MKDLIEIAGGIIAGAIVTALIFRKNPAKAAAVVNTAVTDAQSAAKKV